MAILSKNNIKLFFVQLNSVFMLNRIDDENMKCSYLVNILNKEILSSVSDIIFTPPTENPFTTLKNKLLKIFENFISQNTKALLQELTVGDQQSKCFG